MPETTLIVRHREGLHSRPARLFVQTARRFPCDIVVSKGGQEVNAKSILRVLSLGVGWGTEIVIRAEGESADEALAALTMLIENNFGEDS